MMTSGDNGLRVSSLTGGAYITNTGVAAQMIGDGTPVPVLIATLKSLSKSPKIDNPGIPRKVALPTLALN
jgi:hypothetical protein